MSLVQIQVSRQYRIPSPGPGVVRVEIRIVSLTVSVGIVHVVRRGYGSRHLMPNWWNGRHSSLRNWYSKECVSSNLTFGTRKSGVMVSQRPAKASD